MMDSSPRPLLPASPGHSRGSGSPDQLLEPSQSKKRKDLARVACESCRKKKVKCDAKLPKCSLCHTHNRPCIYGSDPGITRTESLKRKNETLQQRVDVLETFMQFLRSRAQPEVLAILQRIKASPEDVNLTTLMDFVSFGDLLVGMNSNETLPHKTAPVAGTSERIGQEGSATLAELASRISSLSDTDQALFLRATHDKLDSMEYGSSGSASVSSSASIRRFDTLVAEPIVDFDPTPWTAVTTDTRLVSHLVSLFITWDHTYSSLIPHRLFIRDLKAGQTTPFCNKFLVTMLLSCGCNHAIADSVRVGSGIEDANALSESFFKEAKEYWETELGKSSLANIQALHLMHLRYGILGQDKMGNLVSNQVIAMSHDLNLHSGVEDPFMSREELQARRVVAWGLFCSTATTFLAYLRSSPLPSTKALRPDADYLRGVAEEWAPYPSISSPLPAHYPNYFDARCDLDVLTCEALDYLSGRTKDKADDWSVAKSTLDKLTDWKSSLKEYLRPSGEKPPYILTLHMQCHVAELVLSGIFRIGDHSEAREESDRLYVEASANFGHLISQHRRAFGSKRGCPGVMYYACVCLSALLSIVTQHSDLSDLVHEVLLVAVNISHRIKIGRGMLRVMAEQVEAFSSEVLKPETFALFGDIKINIWKPGDHQSYSSAWTEFSGGVSGLTTNESLKMHELTNLLEALSAKESAGSGSSPWS